MVDSQQPPNPLQLGQTLYEVLDATLIATPLHDSAASYYRLICNADGIGPAPGETARFAEQDHILDVKAGTDMNAAAQKIFVLTSDSVRIIGSAGGRAMTTWPVSGLSRIVGLDPQQTSEPHLLLLGQDAHGAFLQSLDCHSGALSTPLRLPAEVAGSAAGAVLVRNQTHAHVLVCMARESTLTVHDLGRSVLGAAPSVVGITSLHLGGIQDSAVVGLVTASLITGTADQQVVLAYPDASGALRIAVLGWNADTLVSVATLDPDLSFAPPDAPRFRVAAGDLVQEGVDQVVIGYPASYAGVAGCAALLLLELDNTVSGTPPKLLSKYVVANAHKQPLASIDLHLAVGLFGEALPGDQHPAARQRAAADGAAAGILGVLVVGGGATFSQVLEGEGSILAGLVTVDPVDKSFPPLGTAPGVPELLTTLETIDYGSPGFFALPSDVTGRSVILGSPTLSQAEGKGQLLAIIQAPPFERAVSVSAPTLAFGQGETEINGCNVSSNKTWMFSNDTAVSLGIPVGTLSRNVNNSYGHGFDQLDDNSTSTLMQSTMTISRDDLMVLYTMSYYVWTYPVYRKANQSDPDGTMAVVFPVSPEPQQSLLVASDPSLGYAPRSQNGILLSYQQLQPDGFDPSLELFGLYSIAVTDEQGGALFYDQTKMVSQNVSKTSTVHNTTTDSEHFSISTTLFQYIPVNFGLNLTQGQNYSESEVQTTTLSHTVTMSITVTTGSVNDIGYEYVITPYIYQHKTLGCLVVTYQVALRGKSWADYYRLPQARLQALYPFSADKVLASFSRSISFKDNDDGTVEVSVEIFNNSLDEINDVVCEFYKGAPVLDTDGIKPSGDMVGQRRVQALSGTGRTTVSLPMTLARNDQVTVSVYVWVPPVQLSKQVYWAVYPPAAFGGLPGLRSTLALEAIRAHQ
jgi:hypothetical protein